MDEMPSIVLMSATVGLLKFGARNVDETVRQAKVGFGVLSLLALMLATSASAQFAPGAADPLPDARGVIHCPLTPGVLDADWPLGVPPVLVGELGRSYGPFAAPGEPYAAASDRPGPPRRIMFARHKGRHWVIAYEEGASLARPSRSARLLLYQLEPTGEVRRLQSLTSYNGLLCRSSTALLARFPADR
jgi:hypothetical protein